MQRDIRNFCAPSESLTEENNNNVESDAVGHETQPTGAGQPRKRRNFIKSLTAQEIQEQLNESQESQDPDSDFLCEDLLRDMEVDNELVNDLLAEQEADEEAGLEVVSQPEPEPGPSSATATASAGPSGDSISAEDAERGLKVLQENLAGLGG